MQTLSEDNTVLVKTTLKSFEGFFFITSSGKPLFLLPPKRKLNFCRSPNIPWKPYRLLWPAGQCLDRRWRGWGVSPAFYTGQKRAICTPLQTVAALLHEIPLASSTRKSGDNHYSWSHHTRGCRLQWTAMACHFNAKSVSVRASFLDSSKETLLKTWRSSSQLSCWTVFSLLLERYRSFRLYCTWAEPIPAIPLLQLVVLEIKLIHSV